MIVFEWTESEIALMASLDPFTYIFTIYFFSWAMDVKGIYVNQQIIFNEMKFTYCIFRFCPIFVSEEINFMKSF